jgi:ATP-dependent exoDNAse (exonuclease V) alpha subunit
MSRLNELLHESEKTNERLKQAIVSGDYDLMTKIERSKVELSNRIFFARRDDFAERLNDLRIEKQCAVELSAELADELKTAAGVVLQARSALFDAEMQYQAVQSKQYFVSNQIEQNRQNTTQATAELNRHIQSRLSGIPGSDGATKIDLMENDLCEI